MSYTVIALFVVCFAITIFSLMTALNANRVANIALAKIRKQRFNTTDISYEPTFGTVWVIYNPIKIPNIDTFIKLVRARCLSAGYSNPHFVSTTKEDTGYKQGKDAVEAGAKLVIAAGGDGTVRWVAAALAGTDIPLGIIPVGTGNLLARNLNIPLLNIEQAMAVSLTGKQSSTDVGWLTIPEKKPEPFLVMAGVGFDGDIMSGVNQDLKMTIGWGAYFVSGIKAIIKPPMDLKIWVGANDQPRKERTNMLLFGSCGELVGGLNLLPEAIPGDGWLDMAQLTVRAGIIGWAEITGRVILRSIGVQRQAPQISAKLKIEKVRYATVEVEDDGRDVQVDGDPLGCPRRFTVEVVQQALKVRVP